MTSIVWDFIRKRIYVFIRKGETMTTKDHYWIVLLTAIVFCNGCQFMQTGTETRTDEQMLAISYENAEAERIFNNIVHGTERETHYKALIGTPSCHLYSKSETVAFNAHCNDHIKAMDKDADLLISQREAEDYYQHLSEQGKIKKDT